MIAIKIVLFFGILIFVHELGHFIVAKAVGVRVDTFSLGFGPRIFGFKKGDTDYRVSAVPLGGYVKMAGQFDIPDEEAMEQLTGEPWEFLSKPWWQRLFIASAGSLMNIFLAFFVFFLIIFIWGFPIYHSDVKIGPIDESMPEYQVFEYGDYVTHINGKEVESWDNFNTILRKSPNKNIQCKVLRENEEFNLSLTPEGIITGKSGKLTGRLGVEPYLEPIVGRVFDDQPAASGPYSMLTGDQIIAINDSNVKQWKEMRAIVAKNPKKSLDFKIKRMEPFVLKLLTEEDRKDLSLYGITLNETKDVIEVTKESKGHKTGILLGDRVLSIELSKIPWWKKVLYKITWKNAQQVMAVKVQRTSPFISTIITRKNPFNDEGYIGISHLSSLSLREVGREELGFIDSISYGAKSTIFYSQIIFITIQKLIQRELSMDNLAGPVGITQMIGEQAKSGIKDLLEFLAILSINLGIINFFPIPVLDGGMIVVLLVEGIRRKPLTIKVQIALQKIGLLLLIPLIIYVTYNDIIRVFSKILTP